MEKINGKFKNNFYFKGNEWVLMLKKGIILKMLKKVIKLKVQIVVNILIILLILIK